ncbi:MAG: hypothetical protein HW401_381 [Parcubacteria group bacterium]|nr:hypothetical protein [Parcubacteria group bacterium]
MLGLVGKFQQKLQVSRRNAIWRVIAFIFCCVLFLAIAVCPFILSYNGKDEVKTLLLPCNYIEVEEILNADFFVDRAQFMSMPKIEGNETFFSFSKKEEVVYYLTTKAGLKYVYKETIPVPSGYFISSQGIQNGFLVSEIIWDPTKMALFYAFLPAFLLGVIGFVLMFVITWRSSPVHGEVALSVW